MKFYAIEPEELNPALFGLQALSEVKVGEWHGLGDVRGYQPPADCRAFADLLDAHPVTSKPFRESRWFVFIAKGH